MSLVYKTCFLQYAAKTDGTPATGYVEFKPNSVLVYTDTGIILNDTAIVGYLDPNGRVEVSLLCNDSAGIDPLDWSWNVEEKIDGGTVWWMQIASTMDEPINLKDLYTVGSAPPTITIQGPAGPTGDTGPKGDKGDKGDQGVAGQAAVILGEFTRNPAELPPDGLVPADWDSPGKPAQDHQFVPGEAVHYTPDGHLWSYVGIALVAAGWQDVGQIVGPPGPKGDPGELQPEDIIAGANITVTEHPTNGTVTIAAVVPTGDHGGLTGLADDDHTQYHNNTRGDARYDAKGAGTAAVNTHVAAADPHTQYLKKTDTALPEVEVGTTPPAAENILLFVDTDAPSNPNASFDDLDARYVNVTGDTMTEQLAVPVVFLGGHVKLGASDADGLVVWNEDVTALETVTCANPVNSDEAATKGYVDDRMQFGQYPLPGNTMFAPKTWWTFDITFPTPFPSIPRMVLASFYTPFNTPAGTNGAMDASNVHRELIVTIQNGSVSNSKMSVSIYNPDPDLLVNPSASNGIYWIAAL